MNLKQMLETVTGPLPEEDFKEICNMATADIKANRTSFSKCTRLGLCIYIMASCALTYYKAKRKSTMQSA
jgi:hypothetical protein